MTCRLRFDVFRWNCATFLFFALSWPSGSIATPNPPLSVTASTQTKERAPKAILRVTWSDVLRLVELHPKIAVGQFQVNAAESGVEVAGSLPNPTLEGTLGRGKARIGDASRVEWGLALSMPLSWIAQRSSKLDVAKAEVDVALAEGKVLRREVLLHLGNLFWALAFEQARVGTLSILEAESVEWVRHVTKRVTQGEVRPLEATRVEIELEKVRSELDAARASLEARQAQLSTWLGVPRGRQLEVVADLDALPIPMDLEPAISQAKSINPALASQRAKVRSLESAARNERMARIPAVVVSGFTTQELDRRSYGVGLGVDVPIWNWNSGRIAQAEAKLAIERKQVEIAALDLETTVIDAQAACRAAVATAIRFRNNVVPRSEVAASTMGRMYELGETSLFEVIDARRTLLESRRLYLHAAAQTQIECSRLSTLVGAFQP